MNKDDILPPEWFTLADLPVQEALDPTKEDQLHKNHPLRNIILRRGEKIICDAALKTIV
jgi:hypothetical protein